jgi:hypothetical protein
VEQAIRLASIPALQRDKTMNYGGDEPLRAADIEAMAGARPVQVRERTPVDKLRDEEADEASAAEFEEDREPIRLVQPSSKLIMTHFFVGKVGKNVARLSVMLDPGAQACVIDVNVFEAIKDKLPHNSLVKGRGQCHSFNDKASPATTYGTVNIVMRPSINSAPMTVPFHLTDVSLGRDCRILMGLNALTALGAQLLLDDQKYYVVNFPSIGVRHLISKADDSVTVTDESTNFALAQAPPGTSRVGDEQQPASGLVEQEAEVPRLAAVGLDSSGDAARRAQTARSVGGKTVHPELKDLEARQGEWGWPPWALALAVPFFERWKHRFWVSGALPPMKGWEYSVGYSGKPFREPVIPLKPEVRIMANDQIDAEVKSGMLRELFDPTEIQYVSSVFYKKEGSKYRRCTNYVRLNKDSRTVEVDLPSMERIKADLAGKDLLIGLDGKAAYNQVLIVKEERMFFVFALPGRKQGQIRYLEPQRMQFGSGSAPGFFQWVESHMFEDVPEVSTYLDDLNAAIDGKGLTDRETFSKGLEVFDTIMERADRHNVTFAWSKFEFLVQEKSILGWIVGRNGIRPDPHRVQTLLDWDCPTTGLLFMRFMGFYNYLAKSMPPSIAIDGAVRLCQKQMQVKGRVQLTPEIRAAFEQVKAKGAAWIMLAPFDYNKPVIVQTDSSKHGVGFLIMQYDDERKCRRIVHVGARVWPEAAHRYQSHDLEGTGIMNGVRKYALPFRNCKLVIETDNQPAAAMLSTRDYSKLPAKWQRFRNELKEFAEVEVRYVTAKGVVACDALSRRAQMIVPIASEQLRLAAVAMGLEPGDHGEAAAELQGEITLRAAQELYPPYAEMMNELRKDKYPRSALSEVDEEFFFLSDDGALWRKGSSKHTTTVQACLPPARREAATKEAHVLGEHLSWRYTTDRLRAVYWWKSMGNDTAKFVRKCRACQLARPRARKLQQGDQRVRQVSDLFQTFSADVLQLSVASEGMRHILVIQCMFSGFLILIAVCNQTAEVLVDEIMSRVVAVFGPPEALLTDQGMAFISKMARKVTESVGTKLKFTFSHWGEGNAMNERSHASLMKAIAISCEVNQTTWRSKLPMLQYAMNTTGRRATSLTAYDIVFARRPRSLLQKDVQVVVPGAGDESAVLVDAEMKQMAANLRATWRRIAVDDQRAREVSTKTTAPTFEVGNLVTVVYPPEKLRTSKHSYKAMGPYEVMAKVRSGIVTDYMLRHLRTNAEKKVNWQVMFRYYPSADDNAELARHREVEMQTGAPEKRRKKKKKKNPAAEEPAGDGEATAEPTLEPKYLDVAVGQYVLVELPGERRRNLATVETVGDEKITVRWFTTEDTTWPVHRQRWFPSYTNSLGLSVIRNSRSAEPEEGDVHREEVLYVFGELVDEIYLPVDACAFLARTATATNNQKVAVLQCARNM